MKEKNLGKLRAWQVWNRHYERSTLVMARSRPEAIQSGLAEIECSFTTYIEAHVKRRPEFDGGIPSWEVLVREHGWWQECRSCDHQVHASDLEDGAAYDLGPLEPPICKSCNGHQTSSAS